MGICLFKSPDALINKEDKSKDALNNQSQNNNSNKQDDPLNLNLVFEEIGDIQDLQIKGAMLLSESIGKPKDNYETKENISPVSYGLIKKVKHKLTSKIRAMRIIKKELIEVKEEETFIFKELALLRTLDHPNIIKQYEFYRDEKFYYLLSEFCSEGELFKIIKAHPTGFNEYTVCYIMKQLLSVVFYCHNKKIVNRDLRPENILIESIEYIVKGEQEVPLYHIKVKDFKSARCFSGSKKLNKKVGNPFYIAPEVLRRKYNEKCDVWSCGIIMYILLTGKPPVAGSTDKEVLDKVEQGLVFDFFDADLASHSAECKQLLKELLRFDPVKRITPEDALKHKWFKTFKIEFSIDQHFILNCFNSLMKFSPEQKFAQATMAFMVHHLTETKDLIQMTKLFELFDANGDGKISHMECLEGFKRTLGNVILNEKEFLKIIKKIDQDKSGLIEYEEFIRAVIKKSAIITEENLDLTFRMFDKDGSGSIEPGELKAILGLSTKYSDKVWNEIINQIEHENENEITYDEFKGMMIKLIDS